MNPFKRKAMSQRTSLSHTTACKCARCAAIAAGATPEQADAQRRKWEAEQIRKHGWYIDFVAEDSDSPTGFNAHTHGLQQLQDHPDFQIVVPMPTEVLHPIMITLADRVKTGERFVSGQVLNDVLAGKEGGEMCVKLIDAMECNRSVLRVILPDKYGKLDLEEIAAPFDRQYGDLA